VLARQKIGSLSLLLLLALFSVFFHDLAAAQERWPPWQSYGEAEDNARKKNVRRRGPAVTDVAALNRQIAQLKAAGKYAQAVPLAQRVVALEEKKDADSVEVAGALETLADLYEAQNKYAEAEPLLKRAVAIREKAPGQPGLAASQARLAALTEKQAKGTEPTAMRKLARPKNDAAAQEETKRKEAAEARQAQEDEQRRLRAEEAKRQVEEAEAKRQSETDGRRAAEAELARRRMAEEAARQAEKQRAEAKEAPKPTPPRYSARRIAPEPPVGTRNGGPAAAPSAPAEEMTPGAAAPPPPPPEPTGPPASANGEAPATAPPPMDDAFGGAPPPVASAEPPPPSDEGTGPDLDMRSGGGSGRGAVSPSPTDPAPTTMAPVPPPPLPGAQRSAAEAAPAPEADYQIVPIYWGTDRAVQPNAQRLVFGSDRSRKLQLGEALVTVPKVHEVPKVERPWVVTIPYFDVTIYAEKEDAAKHFTVKEIKELTKEQLLAQVKARLQDSKEFKDQALVFIHGYNTSFDNALYRTAQIAYDLDFDGAPFLYSWPSGGAVASYTYDRESAQASEPYLREFLEMVVKETGAKSVSIIAHSMGNQPLMDVLRDMKSSAPEGVTISQVILAAPDVDADGFTNLAKTIQGLAKNVTLYVASNDRALIVSRNFWGSYRAGDIPPAGPLILPGIDTIDVTAASTDAFAINHSGYASNNKLLEDIGELIKTGLRPPEDRKLKPGKITGASGDYWRYVPPPEVPAATGSAGPAPPQ
jgi:esterase/lipase superfamily enzyme